MGFYLIVILLIAKCLITTFILNIAVVENRVVASELTVIPQWNVTLNQTDADFCSLGTNIQEDVFILTGSSIKTCSVQLTTSNGTTALIQIPEDTLLYAERKGKLFDCQNKYVSLAADEPCVFVSRHPNLQVYLQGNSLNRSSISVRHMPISTAAPICPDGPDVSSNEEQHASTASQTKHCQTDEFNHVILGEISSDYTCSFAFPVNCDVTLSQQNVELQCNEGDLYSRRKSLIVYPTSIIKLDFTQQSIININEHSFTNLKTLKELDLARNKLSILSENVFNGLQRLTDLNLGYNELKSISNGVFRRLRNLKSLSLIWNNISSIDDNVFNETTKLAYLNLHQNNLKKLPRFLFRGLGNLYELNLTENDLTVLPIGLFMDLKSAQYLYLKRNRINSLDEHLFNGTQQIAFLSLWYNNLKQLPKYLFRGLGNMYKLDLDDNELTDLPKELFWGLKNLRYLHLVRNQLSSLDENLFEGLGNLKYLYLSENQIGSLNETLFNHTKKLTYFRIYNNKLKQLQSYLFKGLGNLRLIELSVNKLSYLPKELFMDLKNLNYLYIAENEISTLDENLFKGLNNLIRLYLSWNQITTLNENLFNDTNKLIEFKIYNNNLKQLPKYVFWGLGNLHELELDGNKLTHVPKELFMNLKNLEYLYINDNQISSLDESLFWGLTNLYYLDISYNQFTSLNETLFNDTYKLTYLGIDNNNLKQLPNNIFSSLEQVTLLELYENSLERLTDNAFRGLRNLEALDLDDNRLTKLKKEMFRHFMNLRILYLGHNHLTTLDFDLFQYTRKLSVLDLSSNELLNIPDVSYLHQLFFLTLKDNKLIGITNEALSSLPKQTELIVSQHEICECYVSDDVQCTAVDDRSPFLTCDRLLSTKVFVVLMWLIGLNALGGNIFVLCRRQKTTDKDNVQTFMLRNLAMSDLLMGVYMLLIASADIKFGDFFPLQAETWRSGVTCRIAGTISILSSEASVFFVTLISIDRFICIKYPLSRHRLGKTSSVVLATLLWIVSLALGIVPSVLAGKIDTFYDNSHICIGLPLTKLKIYESIQTEEWSEVCSDDSICYWIQQVESKFVGEINGMIFSSVMFLGVNFICYLFILLCYVEIVRAVLKSSRRAGLNRELKKQIRLTSKVAAIVLTDFLCWFPIIILGILVQAGVLTLSASVFAWCVTFVLPINSAINPYLYTISALISNRRKNSPAKNEPSAKNQQGSSSQSTNLEGQAPNTTDTGEIKNN